MSDASDRGDEGKRFPLNLRTTRDIREKIERAAKQSGRSMSQEVEYRVERSFVDTDIGNMAAAIAVDRAFEAILGTGDAKKLLMAFATAIRMMEIQTGKQFSEDEYTKVAVSKTLWMIFRAYYGPVSDERYSKTEQDELFELTKRTASFACGLIDLKDSGRLPAWVKQHLPNLPE